MSGLLDVIIVVFRFILEAILDLICFILYCISLVAFWRIPFLVAELKCESRNDYRLSAALAFGAAMWDIVTLPFLLLLIVSWRTVALFASFQKLSWKLDQYNAEYRIATWIQVGQLIVDLPCILMALFSHVALWRIPFFYYDIGQELSENGTPLCCGNNESKHRSVIVYHFLNALFEIAAFPLFILVFGTVYRVPLVLSAWKDDSLTVVEKKLELLKQAALVLLDFPFALMFLLTMMMIWRAKAVIEDLCNVSVSSDVGCERRLVILRHFGLSIRDVLIMPLFIPLIVSVYRAIFAVKQVLKDIAPWANTVAVLSAASAIPSTATDRSSGLIVTIRGTKAAEFSLDSRTSIRAFIRNEEFWEDVAKAEGTLVATVGQSAMPVSLAPKWVDPTQLRSGETDFELIFDFDVTQKTKSIFKHANYFASSSQATIQIEFGEHAGTLTTLVFKPAELQGLVESGRSFDILPTLPCTAEQLKGKRLCDSVWKAVLIQFAFLCVDLVAFILLIFMHLVPHRIFRVYSQGGESRSRKKLRTVGISLEKLRDLISQQCEVLDGALDSLDMQIRDHHYSFDQPEEFISFKQSFDRHCSTISDMDEKDIASALAPFAVTLQDFLNDYAENLSERFTPQSRLHSRPFGASIGSHAKPPGSRRGRNFQMLGDLADDSFFPEPQAESLDDDEPTRMGIFANGLCLQKSVPNADHLSAIRNQFSEVAVSITPQSVREFVSNLIPEQLKQVGSFATEVNGRIQGMGCCGKPNEGWPGFRMVLFREVAEFGFDIAALLSFCITLCTLYRTYSLCWSVYNSKNKRLACVKAFAEIFIDLYYLLKFSLVLCGIRGIFTLPVDIIMYVIRRPSFFMARQVIDHHFRLLLSDLVYVLSLVFAWDALRLVAATVVFALFAPGVLLESAFSKWHDDDDGRPKIAEKNLCRAILLLFVATSWMFGVSFFVAYFIGIQSTIAAFAVYFGVIGVFCSLGVGASLIYQDPHIVRVRRCIVRHVKPTLHNWCVYVAIFLDILQLLAVMISASNSQTFSDSDLGSVLRQISRCLLLDFGQSWTTSNLPFGTYFSVVVMILHFVLAAMPIVTGHMLKWRDADAVVTAPIWTGAMQFLGQICMVTVTRHIAMMLCCDPATRRNLFSSAVVCWDEGHVGLAVTMMIFYVYYLPSATMRNATFDESACRTLDIVFAQLFKSVATLLIVLGVVLATVLHAFHYAVACAVVIVLCSGLCSIWTIAYGAIVNTEEGICCSVRTVEAWKGASFVMVTGAGVFVAAGVGAEIQDSWPLYVAAGMIVLTFIFSILNHFRITRIPLDDEGTLDEIRTDLASLERDLHNRNATSPIWQFEQSSWRSDLSNAARASTFALLAAKLERHIFAAELAPSFLRSLRWRKDVDSVIDVCDLDRDINVNYELRADDWATLIICCSCDCCSHHRNAQRRPVPPPEDEKLIVLQRVVMALKNASDTTRRDPVDA